MFNKFSFIQRGSDEISVRGGIVDAMNVFVDDYNSIVVRPPILPHLGFPDVSSSCRGIFNWRDKNILVFCFEDRIFTYSPVEDSIADITPTDENDRLTGPFNMISFAATPNWLLMSDGGSAICAWNGTNATAIKLAGEYAPPPDLTRCVGLAFMDGYVLAADENQAFYYTNLLSETPSSPPTWNPVGLKAESLPDRLVAIKVFWREIYLFGEAGCEVWYNSGQDIPFSRVESAYIHSGTVARDSIVFAANQLFWINNENHIVRSDGRGAEIISEPIKLELSSIKKFNDVAAFQLANFVVFTFLTDRKTFVFDIAKQGWLKWGLWQPESRKFFEYPAYAAVKASDANRWIVGEKGRSGIVDFTAVPDNMLDFGEMPIKAEIKTNVVTYDTLAPKFVRQFNIFLRGDRL